MGAGSTGQRDRTNIAKWVSMSGEFLKGEKPANLPRHQPKDSKSARPDYPSIVAYYRRDRIALQFAAVHESGCGTFETCRLY
jgi:hypothetical protein